jgi:beta-lysine 5,6-aminomutase beta subunit
MTIVRPYGDTTGDGMVQLSFTLPVPHSKVAEGAAVQLANKMGMDPALVVHSKPMGPDFTFFVVYGRVSHLVDTSTVEVVERDYPLLTPKEVNAAVKRSLRRRLVVVGGCIGTDAHTVGIDAIMNMKGFAGDYGLERYPWIDAVNLGAQVPCERLLREAQERSADAILVSQVVTQKQVHARQLTKLVDLLEAEGVRDRYLLVCGGPRLSNTFAKELGYDAGFGPGSTPSTVAGWIAQELVARKAG